MIVVDRGARDQWIGCVFAGAILATVAVVMLYPVFVRAPYGHRPSDLAHIKQVAVGLIMYASDWDERFPPRDRWFDRVNDTAIKNEAVARCVGLLEEDPEGFGHALNAPMAGADADALSSPATSLLVFDSIDLSRNAVSTVEQIPNPGRNNGRNTIGYVDGHAKMVAIGERF